MAFDFDKFVKELEKKAADNQIGKKLVEGISEDISDESHLAVTSLENFYVVLETVSKNAEKNEENRLKKHHNRALKNLKNALDLGFITEKEYCDKMKKYRDENLKVGTDAWFKATEEIVKTERKIRNSYMDEQKAELQKYSEIVDHIIKLREKLADNLKNFDTDFVTSRKIRFHNINDDGSDLVVNLDNISDFSKENGLLQRFYDAVLALNNLGYMPDEFFSEIGEMDVEEAVSVMEKILAADEDKRRLFAEGYGKKNALAESIAGVLNSILNKEKLEDAGIDPETADLIGNGFIEHLEAVYEEVPEEYYRLGENSAMMFGDGLESKLQVISEKMRDRMRMIGNGVAEEFIEGINAKQGQSYQDNSRVYNNSYTFNASKSTITEQLAAVRQNAVLEKLRGVS